MSKRSSAELPRYHEHRAKGRAFAYFRDADGQRRRRYFPGAYGSPESRRAYAEFLAAHAAGVTPPPAAEIRRREPAPITVLEVAARFLEHADTHYRKNGEPTGETENFEHALRPVLALFGDTPAAEFRAKALKAVRSEMERSGLLSRRVINSRVRRIRHVFGWAVAEEMVPPDVHHALRAVTALQPGRTTAPERKPVDGIPVEHAEAVLPYLTPTLAAMVRFGLLTGARPGETIALRWQDVDKSDPDCWIYRVPDHKNYHRSHERLIAIGPRAQSVLEPFLDVAPAAFVFSPERSERERRALRRQLRATPLTPSQRERDQRRADRPRRALSDRWDVHAFRRAIHRACDDAGVERFSPNQLRHTFADVAESRGLPLELVSKALGHAQVSTTEIYRAKRKLEAVREASRRMG